MPESKLVNALLKSPFVFFAGFGNFNSQRPPKTFPPQSSSLSERLSRELLMWSASTRITPPATFRLLVFSGYVSVIFVCSMVSTNVSKWSFRIHTYIQYFSFLHFFLRTSCSRRFM